MDIALDKVCELILRVREIDVKEGLTDPDSGSNPIDDGSTDVLTADPDDSTEDQVREFLAGLGFRWRRVRAVPVPPKSRCRSTSPGRRRSSSPS